jgi:sarcosine oxidase gamma subunit
LQQLVESTRNHLIDDFLLACEISLTPLGVGNAFTSLYKQVSVVIGAPFCLRQNSLTFSLALERFFLDKLTRFLLDGSNGAIGFRQDVVFDSFDTFHL